MTFNLQIGGLPPDMENGNAPITPSRLGPFASGSQFPTNLGSNTNVPPPPKKLILPLKLRQPREPTIKDLEDSPETTPQNQDKGKQQEQTGYGLHNAQDMDEDDLPADQQQAPQQQGIPRQAPVYHFQDPTYEDIPRIIKEPGLAYDGTHFMKFLDRFELAASIFRATDKDKAMQISRFVPKEELKSELKRMDGYKTHDWEKLRKAMVENWGELDDTILYMPKDLIELAESWTKKGGLKNYRDYKAYLGKFTSILTYLVENEQVAQKKEASLLFLSAFSVELRKNLKRALVNKGQLPKAPNGSNKLPLWQHVVEAASTEIIVEEDKFYPISGFGQANRTMQQALNEQKGNSQRRDRMIEETPMGDQALKKQVADLTQELSSLKQKLVNKPSAYNNYESNQQDDYSRGNNPPSGPLYTGTSCYYCKRETHSTYRCPEAMKDEEQGLVRREGKDWYLPNGQHIPWNPSRPIRAVVAQASSDPKMQEAAQKLVQSRKSSNSNSFTQVPQILKNSAQTVDWEPPQLGADSFLRNQAITRAEAQKVRRVRIQEPANDDMDIDLDEEIAKLAKEPPKTVPEKVWSRDKTNSVIEKNTTPEQALLQELDHLKIPTTFAQLTTISPTYTEKVIAKLQGRLPGKNNATYITDKTIRVSAAMTNSTKEENSSDPCYYSCALGYVSAEVGGAKVDFMIDSGSMVNVIPRSVAQDLDLEMIQVDIPMKGVGGARCDLNGVAENCPITIGRFSGPAHLFISPKAQECILGRPFLFDYGCTLEYHETGETLSFQGTKGRRVSVPLARIGQGKGWNNQKDLSTNMVKQIDQPSQEHRMFKKKPNQSFL
ncbi:hypothetical protein MJO28_012439 [Puccinia striiformis f. sp. tritici]|uniref:Uncharacterized protein n=1 Tax=Puccinia striiformis f. sp. tritici TaxID=168172 RepID=A0ACC0E0H0_9BASI|nr:hypothetical protein MJO28_012439 [Puccinia striiformis f. sp. tritici]